MAVSVEPFWEWVGTRRICTYILLKFFQPHWTTYFVASKSNIDFCPQLRYWYFLIFSFITEGVIEYEDQKYESNGDLTVWDAFKIGVKGANQMILGSGLDIMLSALEKAKSDGVSVPPFVEALDMKVLRNLIKTAKTVHDQKLDRWGPRTTTHSGNM